MKQNATANPANHLPVNMASDGQREARLLSADLLLNRSEVAEHFGLTRRFLEVSAVRGDGPPMVKIGRSVRYRVSDLRAWIEARRVSSTSQEVCK